MPRTESVGNSAERPKTRRNLDNRLVEHGKYMAIRLAGVGDEGLPYVEILTIMGILDDDTLKPSETVKLKKVLGLQMKFTPKGGIGLNQTEFWSAVEAAAGTEIAEAKGFAEDLNDIPSNWRAAQTSLGKLHEALLETK